VSDPAGAFRSSLCAGLGPAKGKTKIVVSEEVCTCLVQTDNAGSDNPVVTGVSRWVGGDGRL